MSLLLLLAPEAITSATPTLDVILTFTDYSPSPVYLPETTLWTSARIEESSTATGPWTTIESAFLLNPIVTDPQNPPSYNFSTDGATLAVGWYRVVFIATDGSEEPTEAVQNVAVTNWQPPSVRDLAALMFSRATGEYRALETFTSATRPTALQAASAIASARGMVGARVGFNLDARFHGSARFLSTLYAALILEPGYWPEQQQPDKSAWEQWKLLYDDGMKALLPAIAEAGAGEDVGPDDDRLSPHWAFPLPPVYEW